MCGAGTALQNTRAHAPPGPIYKRARQVRGRLGIWPRNAICMASNPHTQQRTPQISNLCRLLQCTLHSDHVTNANDFSHAASDWETKARAYKKHNPPHTDQAAVAISLTYSPLGSCVQQIAHELGAHDQGAGSVYRRHNSDKPPRQHTLSGVHYQKYFARWVDHRR